MMDILFTNAKLIDPDARNIATGALATKNGKIAAIITDNSTLPDAAQIIDCHRKYLAPGIVDIGVKVCEPGERHKESFGTAGLAAAGGVTTMVTRPDTDPAIDNPETLEFVIRRAREAAPVNVLPMAALTKGRQGRQMTEIGFLLDAGAVAFTDCDHVVTNSKVLARALSYAKSLGALVLGHPQDPDLSIGAAATSGKFASLRGLPAVPPMAERMGLDRDIAIIEMTGASYHADQITTSRALPPLERAKHNGFDITAGTSIHHLTLNALDVANYRTFFKIKPPLRDEDDRLAITRAVQTGLIDIISSMHTPQDEESKRLPFEAAASGAVALETLLPAAMQLFHSGAMDLPTLWRAMSLNPAKRLGLPSGRLSIQAPADLVIFDPHAPFVMDRSSLQSKSRNTPFDGTRMQGKVIRTYVAGNNVYQRP